MDLNRTPQAWLRPRAKGLGGYQIQILVVGKIPETSGLLHHPG